MAIRHIREAFDNEAGPGYSCQSATLDYVAAFPTQRQIITFNIAMPDGTLKTVTTPPHAMDVDPNEEARQVARQVKAAFQGVASSPPAVAQPVAAVPAPVAPAPAPVAPAALPVAPGTSREPGADLKSPFV
jgi:hypothetical protein